MALRWTAQADQPDAEVSIGRTTIFLHVSNALHMGAFLIYLLFLGFFARDPRGKVIRTASTLIQMSVVLLCIDLLIGFFVIEAAYGSNLSAGWISKSIFGFPALLMLSFVWMWTARRRAKRASSAGADTEV